MTTSRTRAFLAAAALLSTASAAAAPAALAADHLRVTGQGENFAVEYDPSYTGNVVGGGRVLASRNTGRDVSTTYADGGIARAVPGDARYVGGAQSGEVVYLQPSDAAPSRTSLAQLTGRR